MMNNDGRCVLQYTEKNYVDDSKASGKAECDALTYSDAWLSSWSGQAAWAQNVTEAFCEIDYSNPDQLAEVVYGYAQVAATVRCTLLDPAA